MNERQRRFCEEYVACGNAAEAARRAGYSERTARSQGQRLLTFVDVQKYIVELQGQLADERIADAREVREFLTSTMRNDSEKINARLRASNTLLKAAGGFIPPVAPAEEEAAPTDGDGEQAAIVYLPWDGSTPFTAWKDSNGLIHEFPRDEGIVVYVDENELQEMREWRIRNLETEEE